MVELSLAALFACLIPFFLHHLAFREQVTWSLCSGLLLAFEIWLGASASWRSRRAQVDFTLPDWSRTVAVISYSTTLISAVAQLINVAVTHAFGPFLLGIGLLLVRAAIQFTRLVFVAVRGPAA
jgi:hypothetical protein